MGRGRGKAKRERDGGHEKGETHCTPTFPTLAKLNPLGAFV